MELEVIKELINSVGFPIVVCGALFWSNHNTTKRYDEILLKFRDTIDNNTLAIKSLCEKMK